MNINEATKIILSKYSDSIVRTAMESKDAYVFAIEPKDWDQSVEILGNLFKVDRSTGDISEYSPAMDPEEFKYFLKHVVYAAN